MLTILNDPAGITGIRRYKLDYSISLQRNIERHLSGGAGAELRINGSVVDPLSDHRLDLPPSTFDQVLITLRPAGIELAYIAIAAVVVAAVALRPNIPNIDAAGKDSPNNKLTGQSNVARAYQAVPDVYGYRRVWPDLTQPSIVEYVDQLKYVTEWLCVSRGRGTMSDVRYAETPIADIDGSSFEVFEPSLAAGLPELGTTTLADVYEPFASEEVNGQELEYAIAFAQLVKSGTAFAATTATTNFTLTITDGSDLDELKSLSPGGTAVVSFNYTPTGGPPPVNFNQTCTLNSYTDLGSTVEFAFSYTGTAWPADETGTVTATITPNGKNYVTAGPFTLPVECSQLWWNVVFLRGLKGTVTIRAEWWKIDDAGAEIGGTRQTQDDSFGADTFDQRFHTVKATPSAGFGRYRIQFQRRSVQVDENGVDVAKLEELYAIRYYPTKEVPGATVLRVTTKATLSATGFSDRKFNVRWFRHVRTLDSTTSISASRNFGRILAHIWTIAGNDASGIDIEAIRAINNEHGENSPLLRFDGSLDDADMSLGERMALVADTARCKVWRDGTKWTVSREQRKQFPAVQFDYRNLARGGDSTITYAGHLPSSNDGIEVEYVDESTQAKKAYERWTIAGGTAVQGTSRNPKKIRMMGCATQEQARNRALLEANRLLYQRETISDRALADANDLPLGELVRWVDPNDFGGEGLQAGEVLSIDGDTLMTSEPIAWGEATSGRIVFTAEDGTRAGAPTVCYPAGDRLVRVESLPSGVYVASSGRQCGSRYSFATGLTADELDAAGLYVVTELKPASDRTVSIALANYDARIYEAD